MEQVEVRLWTHRLKGVCSVRWLVLLKSQPVLRRHRAGSESRAVRREGLACSQPCQPLAGAAKGRPC